MSRDPPPESRYYREREEPKRTPPATQISEEEICRHEEHDFAHVEFADYGPAFPSEEATSSYAYASTPSYATGPAYAATPTYASAPTYAAAPAYAKKPVYAPLTPPVYTPTYTDEKSLPLPSSSPRPRPRRAQRPRCVRLVGWVIGLVVFVAYITGFDLNWSNPPPELEFPYGLTYIGQYPTHGDEWPARFSVEPLPQDTRKKCDDLLTPPKNTFTKRLERLGDKLGEHVYVMEPGPTALYYTGAFGPGSWSPSERPFLLAVNSTGDLTILTPRFEEARARLKELPKEVEPTWVAWEEHESPYAVLSAHFDGPKWVVDGDVRTFIASGLQRESKEDSKDAEKLLREVQSIRERKDEREIELLRCANVLTLHAIRQTRSRMRLGITEGQTRKILYAEMKKLGLKDYGALVLFGENAALPHGSGTEAKLGKEDFALIDAGGSWGGYVADITRTFFLPDSEIPDAHRSVWEIVRSAQLAPSNFLRLTTPEEPAMWSWMDDRARETVKKGMAYLGVPPQKGRAPDYTVFTHRLGHGVGLQGHEAPYAVQGPLGERPVLAGHTVSQEPGVYIPKGGVGRKDIQGFGVRLEDCAVVAEDKEGRLRLDWFTGRVKAWGDV